MDNIGQLFDNISLGYDKFNHLTSLNIDKRWRTQAISKLQPTGKVLDVAIGTADLAIEILRQKKAEEVIGVDLSEGMMKIGKEKVKERHLEEKITFMKANCEDLPFWEGEFDAITCAYGVRNFAHLKQGLLEMHRVLKPGGQLVILEFSYPTNPFIKWFYDFYFTRIMPIVGKLISHNDEAYGYFPKSVKNFCKDNPFPNQLEETGFSNMEIKRQTFGISTVYTAWKK